MLKKILLTVSTFAIFGQNLYAEDQYHKYGEWNPDGHGVSDVGGFIDKKGLLGNKGDEYVFFRESDTGYIYRVSVDGDPNAHPDKNGENIADRTFTYVNSFPINFSYTGDSEFYIDNSGIYYGSGSGIKKWDFNLVSQPDEINTTYSYSNNNVYSETLARNSTTGEWWTATRYREVYKYNDSNKTWTYQFTYPSLGGGHHDGMEIVNNQLFLSDMTSDKIAVYNINKTTGVVDDPSSYKIYSYTATPDVEGMGFGPNQHFWMSSGWVLYEIGDGELKPTCSQTFTYKTKWQMYRSNCDNIDVSGIDDALMVVLKNGKLQYVTSDKGASSWLKKHGFQVVSKAKLNSGDAFFTFGKKDIKKKVNNGELSSNYLKFKKNVYRLVGFSLAVDLNSKFKTQPIKSISYFINGSWKTWKPTNPTVNNKVPAGQGLYILPSADFGILVN